MALLGQELEWGWTILAHISELDDRAKNINGKVRNSLLLTLWRAYYLDGDNKWAND
ncbi:MAG: hypothetical protein V1754_05460 [Pseudomonadota bacterium]